jgi:hypothetical protein
MPIPLTGPKATTSLFPVFAAAGLLVRHGAILMIRGALSFGSSFPIHADSE